MRATLILALSGMFVGCGGGNSNSSAAASNTPASPSVDLRAGELPPSTDRAPEVARGPSAEELALSQVQQQQEQTSQAFQAVELPEAAPEPESTAAQPWGAPDSEAGNPLPPRQPMNAAARAAYHEGIQAMQASQPDAAARAFERAFAADPRAYKAAYNLGVLSDRGGNEGRAMEYFRQSLAIQADYERAAEGIVAIFIRRGSPQEALSFIAPIASQWTRNLPLQALHAEVLVELERLDEAVNVARAALRRDERFVPAMIAIVKANLKRNRGELAESILNRALEVDANNAEAHFLKGKSLQSQARLGEALTEFRTAVELRGDYAEARIALGIQYLAAGNYEQAIEQFERTVALLPGSAAVHLNLGDAYRSAGQWEKAKASFDRATSYQARLPQAHFNLAIMYMSAGASFPGLDKLGALQRAVQEFNLYRDQMGAQLPRGDASQTYLEDLARQIDREQKRIERERQRAERDAQRRARQAAEGNGDAGSGADTGAGADAGTPAP